MYHFNELYGDTGSKSIEQIEEHARIVHVLSPRSVKREKDHLPEYAFIVSKSRGAGVLHTVKKQCSDGNENRRSLSVAKRNLATLNHSMHGLSKEVQVAKNRVGALTYMNSLLDSCFKGWHDDTHIQRL